MPLETMANANGAAGMKKYDPCKGKPYNRYNIYYILERERFLQSNPNYYRGDQSTSVDIITGYEDLGDLPALPPRYAKIKLSHDWYMPGKRKMVKRTHKKTHGVASFREIARVVADGWRGIDDATLEFCTVLAKMLKQRHIQLKKVRGLKALKTMAHSNDGALKLMAGHGEMPIPTRKKMYHKPEDVVSSPVEASNSPSCDDDIQDFVSNPRFRILNSSVCSEVDIPDQDITSMGALPAEVPSEVDIPDEDILAMWHE